jgi:hypothetical protein
MHKLFDKGVTGIATTITPITPDVVISLHEDMAILRQVGRTFIKIQNTLVVRMYGYRFTDGTVQYQREVI